MAVSFLRRLFLRILHFFPLCSTSDADWDDKSFGGDVLTIFSDEEKFNEVFAIVFFSGFVLTRRKLQRIRNEASTFYKIHKMGISDGITQATAERVSL